MPKSERPSSSTVGSISEQHALVKEAAAGLSLRINQFTKYLATMPGRVEATAFGKHPDAPGLELGLKLHRIGQEWSLSFGARINEKDKDITWRLLEDAPLKIKIGAINLFPLLLENVERSQLEMVKEIINASLAYDDSIGKVLNLPPIQLPALAQPFQAIDLRQDIWKKMMRFLADKGSALTALLNGAELVNIENGQAFIRYSTSEEARIRILYRNGKAAQIEEALSKAIGHPVKVQFEVYDPLQLGLPARQITAAEKGGEVA